MNVAIRVGLALFDALSHDKKREFFACQPVVTHFNGADVSDKAIRGIAMDGTASIGPNSLEADVGPP